MNFVITLLYDIEINFVIIFLAISPSPNQSGYRDSQTNPSLNKLPIKTVMNYPKDSQT